MVIKLELWIIVQLLHVITTGFWFDIKEKEKKKKKQKKSSSSNDSNTTSTTASIATRKCLGMVLINTMSECASKAHYTIVINEKIKKYNLLIVIELEWYEIVLQEHKMQHNWIKYKMIDYVHDVMHKNQLNLLIFKVLINYDLKVLKENSIVQSMHLIWFFDIEKKKKKKKHVNNI